MSSIRYSVSHRSESPQPVGSKVLCVDDDPEILTFIQRCLEAEGYAVDAVSSGEEALLRVETGEYSLVLLDIAMPGLDGWATCRQIKTNPHLAGVHVCMVTAKPVDSARERNRLEGPDGILLKPFRPEDLIELVRGLENLQPFPSA
jgi:CheY-like chemotaxis protein